MLEIALDRRLDVSPKGIAGPTGLLKKSVLGTPVAPGRRVD